METLFLDLINDLRKMLTAVSGMLIFFVWKEQHRLSCKVSYY